jgi:hypothetical protein
MKKDTKKPPEDTTSDLVKFKRLAMKVISVSKDEIHGLWEKPKVAKKHPPD